MLTYSSSLGSALCQTKSTKGNVFIPGEDIAQERVIIRNQWRLELFLCFGKVLEGRWRAGSHGYFFLLLDYGGCFAEEGTHCELE